MSSTREFVEVGTLWPWGQHISWKSWQVLVGAFTPAINSVRDTIWKENCSSERGSGNRHISALYLTCLFVDPEDPCANVWIMFVRDMFDGEYLAILFRAGTVRPKARVHLKREASRNDLKKCQKINTFSYRYIVVDVFLSQNRLLLTVLSIELHHLLFTTAAAATTQILYSRYHISPTCYAFSGSGILGSTFLKYLKVLKHTTKEMGSKKKWLFFQRTSGKLMK